MSSLPPNPYQPTGNQDSNPYLPAGGGDASSNPYAPPTSSDLPNPYAPNSPVDPASPYMPAGSTPPSTELPSAAPQYKGPSYAQPNAAGNSPYAGANLPGAAGAQARTKSNKSAFVVVAAIVCILIGVVFAIAMMMSMRANNSADPVTPPSTPTTSPSTTDPGQDSEDEDVDPGPAPTNNTQSNNAGGQGTTNPGTRDNPNPLGSTIMTSDWNITVKDVNMNGNAYLEAEDPYNLDTLQPGEKFILVDIYATYVGSETGFSYDIMVDFVSKGGEVYNETYAYFPERWGKVSEVYPGGSISGKVAIAIPEDATGVIRITPGYYDVDPFFVATQ